MFITFNDTIILHSNAKKNSVAYLSLKTSIVKGGLHSPQLFVLHIQVIFYII